MYPPIVIPNWFRVQTTESLLDIVPLRYARYEHAAAALLLVLLFAMGITWRASFKYGAVWDLSTRALFRPWLASRDVWMLRSIGCRCVLGGGWLCDRECECSELVQ